MPRLATSTAYFYPDCPVCGREVMWPVERKANRVVTFTHGRNDCNARLAVLPDTSTAGQHCVHRIPGNVSMEAVIESYHRHEGAPWRWSIMDARSA